MRRRVLVIDDEAGVRAAVCELLAELGYDADEAEDGPTGLTLLLQHRYDVVVTDLRMPRMTGWDVVEAVRARVPTMPMIMTSAFAIDDEVSRAQRVGVPLLPKPFSVAELRRVIREVLSERETKSDVPRKPLTTAPEERQREPEAREEPGP